jgi:hypothetical protein
MKHLKTAVLISSALLVSSTLLAQRIKLIEGNLDAVKTEKTINTEFTYDNMRVGKYDKEEEYIKAKTAEYNKKEAGKGDTWAKRWVDDRQERFEPQFNELFEKTSEMSITPKAKYTLIYKTNFTEPGFNIAVMRKNAQISGEAWIVETANKGNVIAKISIEKAPGRTFGGYDFDTGERISEAYAMSGKALARFILK